VLRDVSAANRAGPRTADRRIRPRRLRTTHLGRAPHDGGQYQASSRRTRAGRGDQTITDLKPAEQQWVAGNVELAGKIAATLGLDVARGEVIGPEALDTAWAAWLAGHARRQEDPNPFINAFGLAFGAHLVERLGLEWKVVRDEYGTEIAVWGHEGNILVFPPNLVGKRYVAGTQRFFADVAAKTEEQVGHVRAQVADGGAKPSRLGRLFRRNG
jgi:Domain of unknown function (DUF3806)